MGWDIGRIYEDEQLLVVNKPAGLPTVPTRQGGPAVRDVLGCPPGGEPGLRLVHRLDMQTSGVLVLAKTVDAQRSLSQQFERREIEKTYLALVRGRPEAESGVVVAAVTEDPRTPGRMMIARRKGLDAETHWRVVEQLGEIALLRCRPKTGRQHQIRVHLAYIGLPLLIDEIYGSPEPFYLSSMKSGYKVGRGGQERPLIARLTLHAESLTFQHPATGQPLRCEAPLPRDFRAVLAQLRKVHTPR